jgi:putative oxidoreductase
VSAYGPSHFERCAPHLGLYPQLERPRNMLKRFEASSTRWAYLPLRLMLGFGFAAHGYAKLSRGPHNFAAALAVLGIPFPDLTAWVTALFELAGGLSIMAGAFIVPFSIPLAFIMLTAMFTVHLQYGFSTIKLRAVTASGAEFGPPGYEMNLLYLAGLLTLVLARWRSRASKPIAAHVCQAA